MKKSFLKALIFKFPALKRLIIRLRAALRRRRFKAATGGIATDQKLVVFGAYSGRQYACSPKAIYEYMKSCPDYRGFHFVWAFVAPEDFKDLSDERTLLVKYGSPEFEKIMAKAGYWVFNNRLPDGIAKKDDQLYIQTWHGTPFKRLGFDVGEYSGIADDKKSLCYSYITEAKRFDVLLSPSGFYTKAMTTAFGLDRLGTADKIMELGYPRNDILHAATREEVQRMREDIGLKEGQRAVLYAPTWREDALNPSTGSTYAEGIDFKLGLDLKAFMDTLPPDTVLLLRTHYFVTAGEDFSQYGDRLKDVSSYRDLNALYLCADVLVTDYSSVFFDYAILKRPMVFYMYDLEKYRSIRDFYFPVEELPGEVVTDERNLSKAVKKALLGADEKEKNKITEFNLKFDPFGGGASKRVCDALISASAQEKVYERRS